jgi:hypothetical protein
MTWKAPIAAALDDDIYRTIPVAALAGAEAADVDLSLTVDSRGG